MTSPISPGFNQQDLEGRSVRDVVAHNSVQVNDAWCRKVLHKILKSLELQYAMEMPHRAITLDTVVFHANGEPLLISDDIDAAPAPAAQQADDLTALARVIHYAITHEREPAGPLDGRVAGYSAALVAAVDACMDPDPARRPRSVDALRGLLDRVAPTPAPAVATLPATPVFIPAPAEPASPAPAVEPPHADMRRGRRWAVAAGGGAIALALGLVIVPQLRDAGVHRPLVPTPPPAGPVARPVLPAPAVAVPTDQAATSASTDPASAATSAPVPERIAPTAPGVATERTANPASDLAGSAGASSGGTTHSGGDGDRREALARVAPGPARVAAPATGEAGADAPPRTVPGNASYQLQIKPWGVVYVDGIERGVSPPVKRLALPPGPHTIRITNPRYRDSVLEFESAQTTSNGKIIVDFTDDIP